MTKTHEDVAAKPDLLEAVLQVLADVAIVLEAHPHPLGQTHYDGCWVNRVECLAGGIRSTLTEALEHEGAWEYGTGHADDPQAVDMGYSLDDARARVADWNASDPDRKGLVMRRPKVEWEQAPDGAE